MLFYFSVEWGQSTPEKAQNWSIYQLEHTTKLDTQLELQGPWTQVCLVLPLDYLLLWSLRESSSKKEPKTTASQSQGSSSGLFFSFKASVLFSHLEWALTDIKPYFINSIKCVDSFEDRTQCTLNILGQYMLLSFLVQMLILLSSSYNKIVKLLIHITCALAINTLYLRNMKLPIHG